ncbi:restriction endonuclease [Streptomyces viridiviolaceus]|uniref:Restriction endonuclease n=1 Tax=Streptomyces viridiviolaceus TaxID=68282 RepID=A0ABW2ECN2_9ACTN|nr:restriction endonuclease [Streptomyces viridiviolaceus]GHB48380.1 restriction endonuclease [Streptomyces viridiviolaceus]
MGVPSRPVRRTDPERRFDLRATALFFLLLAIILCGMAFLVRTAAGAAERHPLWAGSLAVMGVAAAQLCRSRWRRFSTARYVRRAAEALEEAAETASDSLDAQGLVPDAAQTTAGPLVQGQEDTAIDLGSPADYTELDPDGFEHAIAELCARDHCREVEVVGGAGDLGADVIAVTPDGRRLVIQCKRYGDDHKVGSQDMQRFGGTCFTVHEADIAVLVTTSDFTAPALEYAQQCGIVCLDGQDLHAWRDGAMPCPWERAGIDP